MPTLCVWGEKKKKNKQSRSYLGPRLGRIRSGERSRHCGRNTITEPGDFLTSSPQASTLGRLASHFRMLKGQRASAQQACQRPEPLLAVGVQKEGNLAEVQPRWGHNELHSDKRRQGTNARGRQTLTQTTADNRCSLTSLYFYPRLWIAAFITNVFWITSVVWTLTCTCLTWSPADSQLTQTLLMSLQPAF